MSAFLSFADSAARITPRNLSEVVPADKVPLLFDVAGYFVNRTKTQVIRLKPVLESIAANLPKVAEGPQIILHRLYNNISAVSGILSQSAQEQDKRLPPSLHVTGLVTEAFGYLGQFHPYLPSLISPTECSKMVSAVPQLQACIKSVQATFDKLLGLIPQCEAEVLKNAAPVDVAKNPLVHLAAAAIVAVENAVVDLNFVMQNENVTQSEACEMLRKWLPLLAQYSGAVFSQTLTNPAALLATTSSVLGASPPLLGVVSDIEKLVSNDEQFCEAAAHIIEMMQFVNTIESRVWVDYAKAVANLIPFLFQKQKEPAEMVDACGKLLALFTNHIKGVALYDGDVVEGTCRAMLEQYATNHEEIAFVSATVARCLASMAGDMDSGDEVLLELITQMNKILMIHLPGIQEIVSNVMKLYMENLVAFSERQLSYINYYCLNISQVTTLDVSDKDYVSKVDLLCGLASGLSEAIQRLSSTCSDGKVVARCTELAKQAADVCPVFSKWACEVIHCASAIVNVRGGHLYLMYNYLQQAQVPLPGDLSTYEGDVTRVICLLMNQFLVRDLGASRTIVNVISQLKPVIGSLACDQPQLKCASTIFGAITRPLPPLAENFVQVMDPANTDRVVVALRSAIAVVPPLLDAAVKNGSVAFQSLAYLLAPTCSELVRIVDLLPSEMGGGFTDGLRQALETIWKIAVACSKGDKPPEFESLPQLVSALKQMLVELNSVVNRMNQPSIECEFPDNVKEQRAFENTLAGLTGKVHQAAQKLIETFKGNTVPEISAFIKSWMEAAKNSMNLDYEQSHSIFIDTAMKYISTREGNKEGILASFGPLSVCYCLLSLGDVWDAAITQLHDQMINCVKKIGAASAPAEWERGLREMLGNCEAVATIKTCLPLEKDDKMALLRENLGRALIALQRVRAKAMGQEEKELADSVVALRTSEVLLKHLNLEGSLATVIPQAFGMAVNGVIDAPKLGSILVELTKKWRSIQGFDFYSVPSMNDVEAVLDVIYDQLGIYRDSSTHILTSAKTMDATDEELLKKLTAIASCSSLSGAVALRGLDLIKCRETPVVSTYLQACVGIVTALAKCVRPVEQITVMPADSQSHEIRLHARRIARFFDNLIDMIEAPDKQGTTVDEFGKLKIVFLAKLSNIVNVLCSLTWATCTAFVPEMFATDKQTIESAYASALTELKAAATNLTAKATGSTKDDFQKALGELEQAVKCAIDASSMTDYSANFIPKVIVLEVAKAADVVSSVMAVTESLVDHVILDPDPEAAAKLGDDYALPPLPSGSLELEEAFRLYSQGRAQFSSALADFNKTLGEKLALSASLLSAYNKLKAATDDFATNSMKLAVSTPDARLQVEQHTALHTFSDAFSCVKEALRSRLMRADNFEAEMTEAMGALNAAFAHVNELAEAASKCPKPTAAPVEDDSNLDEVSRELKASANAIEEMSARLQSFSDQIDATGVVFSDEDMAHIDLEAEKGTLPAYVIANANPILVAAQRILVRAQQITAEMIAKYGKIENEKLLIRAAQELSESAALLLICAEILIQGEDNDADFKAITAARIIRASVASLVAQVLVKGGDREGVMDQQVKIVKQYADKIINRAEKIVLEKTRVEESKIKKVGPKLVQKLNLQDRINKVRVQLQNQEKVLYQFRKRF